MNRSFLTLPVLLSVLSSAACSAQLSTGGGSTPPAKPASPTSAAEEPRAEPTKASVGPKLGRVVFKSDHIEINEEIMFDGGRATIKPESAALLDEIAQTIKDHGEIKKVRVEGHCAKPGPNEKLSSPEELLTLSTNRANAVIDALATRGIDKGKFEAQGFGDSKPVASNDTPEGKAKNRRVEFVIVDQGKSGPTLKK